MDDQILVKAVFLEQGWDFDAYAALLPGAGFEVITPMNGGGDPRRFGGLHIADWMRFGNSVFQLSNIVAFCRKWKLPCVYYEREHEFFDVGALVESTGTPFILRRRAEFKPDDDLVLSGKFFFDGPYRLFEDIDRQDIIDQYINPLLPDDFTGGHPSIDDSTITAHFRAGDIFSTLIHPGYGQPPLAYYKLAIENSTARRVVVVYEDTGNPCVEAFIRHAREVGREVITQSSDLRSDLSLLFNSTELVSSFGSFPWTMHALSRRLKKFWYFNRAFHPCPFRRHGVHVGVVRDVNGAYVREIMSNNWNNSDEQRRLMLEYPVENLEAEGW
jgi:hypothetical protein